MTLRTTWPLLAALASAAMLAAAHAFQRFGGLQPCALCLDQRNWHWGVVAVALAGFIAARFKPGLARWACALIGLVLLGSCAQAAYHVAVEQHWVAAQCDARINMGDIGPIDFDAPLVVPSCDQIAWQMFGVSMAGYNAIVSLMLALTSFVIAFMRERTA